MWLVHETHHNFALFGILGGQLTPQACELVVCWAPLANNLPVPAGVIMNINYTVGAGRQAALHQGVVLGKVGGIEGSSKLAVDQELPSNIETKHVELVIVDEMLHLVRTIDRWVYVGLLAVTLDAGVSINGKIPTCCE